MTIAISRVQAISTITNYTHNNLKNRVKQSISVALENINQIFSKNQNHRISSLETATFTILLIPIHIISSPFLLMLQMCIVLYRPAKLVPFEKAKQLFIKDLIARKAFILFYNNVEQCIKPYQAYALQQRGKQGRLKASCLTILKALTEPLAGITFTISLCALSIFHLIGVFFSRKCTIEKGLYLFIPMQLHLPRAIIKLLFLPINIIDQLREI
jgi:hypothetical protein